MRVSLSALLATLFLALLPACGQPEAEGPRAQAGVIDLAEWDFSSKGSVELRGEWGFAPGGDPTSAFAGNGDSFIEQPGVWNARQGGGTGRATLFLSVILPPDHPPLALAIPDVSSAYRLHLNGAPALAVGRIGDDADSEVPVYARPLVQVPSGESVLEIVMEISNHHHFEGGIGRAVRIGPSDALYHERETRQMVSVGTLGALAVVVLLQLGFWAGGRRERAFLLFAAFTALMAWRTSASGLVYTMVDPTLRADWWYLIPSYGTLFVFPGIYLAFLRELFPAEVPRVMVRPAIALSAVALSMLILLPPAVYTRLRDVFSILILVMPVIGTVPLVLAAHRRRIGAVWMLAGSTAFLATVVNDSLHYQRIIQSTDLSSLGFGALAVAFTAALALRLFRSEQEAADRLALLNRDLEDKVTERTASLAEAKTAAERASRAKSEFLAVMSHEIRTPLHGLAGVMELLEATPLTDRQRAYVGTLRKTGEQMNRLLGDILDMAQIESGRAYLEYAPFALDRLVGELQAYGRTGSNARGLAFAMEKRPGLPATVLGDESAVRQIVTHFLDNAIKFTAQGGVGLVVEPAERGRVRFAVSDTGCGVPAERRDDVFTPFTQLDSSSRRMHEGSGLGLAIARSLATMMGGSVGVEDNPEGGSLFWCELPLPATDDAPSTPLQTDRSLPMGTNVLIADDVLLNRMVLRDFLVGAGCQVDEAVDGAEAIKKAVARPYDLIVLDLRMPGTDGFQAARAIREHEKAAGCAHVPLAALTAGAAAEERGKALKAGFDLFLAKPIERDALLAALATLLPETRPNETPPPPPAIPAGLEHMLPLFVAEMEKDAARLAAIQSGDRGDLTEFVHAMRGKCGMFGEETLFQLLTSLELCAKDASLEEVEQMVARVADRAAQLRLYQSSQIADAP